MKFCGKIPHMVYFTFVIVSILMIVVAGMIVSFSARVLDRSGRYVKKWGRRVAMVTNVCAFRRRYWIRVWKAVSPVGLEMGCFGKVDKMSILCLGEVWVDYTIAILLF